MVTRLVRTWWERTVVLRAGLPAEVPPGANQKAMRLVVCRKDGPATRCSSWLDEVSPAPSFAEPASVGL